MFCHDVLRCLWAAHTHGSVSAFSWRSLTPLIRRGNWLKSPPFPLVKEVQGPHCIAAVASRVELIFLGPLLPLRSLDLICSLCPPPHPSWLESQFISFFSSQRKNHTHQAIHENNGLSWTEEGEHNLEHKSEDLLFTNKNNFSRNKQASLLHRGILLATPSPSLSCLSFCFFQLCSSISPFCIAQEFKLCLLYTEQLQPHPPSAVLVSGHTHTDTQSPLSLRVINAFPRWR